MGDKISSLTRLLAYVQFDLQLSLQRNFYLSLPISSATKSFCSIIVQRYIHCIYRRSTHTHTHTIQLSTMSTAIPAPTSTITPTVPCAGIPNLNFTGLNGTVCAVSIPPSNIDISSCCSGSVRVENNCTQYCETDEDRFRTCLADANNGTFEGSLCQVVVNGSDSSNQTGDTDEDQPENAGMFVDDVDAVHRCKT
jgi:hypothetical protein